MAEAKTTKCLKCGKDMRYSTKKPKYCTVCTAIQKKEKAKTAPKKTTGGYKKKPDNKNTQGELILFKVLDDILGKHDFINHGYYSFLKSPKGYPMQLDRYYPDLKLAFEYDGKQHETYQKYIHKSLKNFEYYKECDRLKEQYCKDAGITLIRVAWNHKITAEALQRDIQKHNRELYNKIF